MIFHKQELISPQDPLQHWRTMNRVFQEVPNIVLVGLQIPAATESNTTLFKTTPIHTDISPYPQGFLFQNLPWLNETTDKGECPTPFAHHHLEGNPQGLPSASQ